MEGSAVPVGAVLDDDGPVGVASGSVVDVGVPEVDEVGAVTDVVAAGAVVVTGALVAAADCERIAVGDVEVDVQAAPSPARSAIRVRKRIGSRRMAFM